MNATKKTSAIDAKVLLSTTWIFLMFNYLYCDVLALHDAPYLQDLIAGHAGGIELTQQFLLGASVLMEIPITMVLLSRILKYRVNRWANIVAGSIMAVVQVSSLFFGTPPTLYYIFFSTIEIAALLFIVWYAWKWANPEGSPNNKI